jgi:hypothetical protein
MALSSIDDAAGHDSKQAVMNGFPVDGPDGSNFVAQFVSVTDPTIANPAWQTANREFYSPEIAIAVSSVHIQRRPIPGVQQLLAERVGDREPFECQPCSCDRNHGVNMTLSQTRRKERTGLGEQRPRASGGERVITRRAGRTCRRRSR